MESGRGVSSGANHRDSPRGVGDNRVGRRLSRSLHLRSNQIKNHARSGSAGSLDRVFDTRGPNEPPVPVARAPPLTSDEKNFVEKTHGINERRDGFFDAIFLPPEDVDDQVLMEHTEGTLPFAFRKRDPLSLTHFFPRQCHEAWRVVCKVVATRAGIKLLKSFLGFFVAYILCLIPAVRERLGDYAYIMAISAILNHPGRPLGAQVDGTVLTIVGTATGLGWGAFGLWVSTATATARVGFGAILALFLFVYIFIIACLRTYYIRTYQLVICAGIAISYTCLAELSSQVSWAKLLAYGIPWLVGQAVSLVVCAIVAPDAGSRLLAVGLHQIFGTLLDGIPPVQDAIRTRRRLAQAFVSMSQVYRDLVIDFSITFLSPEDTLALRNSVQAVIRSLLSLKTDIRLSKTETGYFSGQYNSTHKELPEFVIEIEKTPGLSGQAVGYEILEFVTERLATPTENLLQTMRSALQICDAALMDMCGHRRYLGPPYTISSDVHSALVGLREHITVLSTRQEEVLASDRLPDAYTRFPDVFDIFAFCRPVHQAAKTIESLMVQLDELQQRQPKFPKFHLPSYRFKKAIHRTNAQVRHDRGGVTAGSYFRSQRDIADMIKRIKSRNFRPVSRDGSGVDENHDPALASMTADDLSNDSNSNKIRFRRRIWTLLHRLQGFETRFGLKTALVTSLLALPAYLANTHPWWDRYGGWWGVVMGWLIMGSRTGGNIQDLFARVTCAVLGSVWAGLAYAAGDGNPYVMAVFAAIFMLPMIYRYTQSAHPRSGIVGCISFTVISLSQVTEDSPPVARTAAIRGSIMIFGVVASIFVNWVLWPFVARHDLRKGLASTIFNCSIVYRSIIAKYVYYEEGNAPTKRDIENSEILEGRLREGFLRLRQLLGLTRHEIRLRAPFDPLPYSALISACEQFFDHIVTVRQSSLFYHPSFVGRDSEAAMELLGYRRDEIATVLTNLYVLSGALRADRSVPKYLPNAAVARKRLLDRTFQLELKHAAREPYLTKERRREIRLGQIYSYSCNDSLTGCVEQVKQVEKYTKIIVGEQGIGYDLGSMSK